MVCFPKNILNQFFISKHNPGIDKINKLPYYYLEIINIMSNYNKFFMNHEITKNNAAISKFFDPKGLKKEYQGYLAFPQVYISWWFAQVRKEMKSTEIQPLNYLLAPRSSAEPQEEIIYDKEKFNSASSKTEIISERIWGIKCGVTHFIDLNACSFQEVIGAAQTEEMADIYSPGIITYYANGERSFKADYLSIYNDDLKLSCYTLINKFQALTLFPQYKTAITELPDEVLFFTDREHSKLKIANQEKNEKSMNFSIPSPNFPIEDNFYLGSLRFSFGIISSEINKGNANFIGQDKPIKLGYTNKKIRLTCGGTFKINEALEIVSPTDKETLIQDFMKNDTKGVKNYHILLDGNLLEDSPQYIDICVAPEIYAQWGKPFTEEETAAITKEHAPEFIDINDIENIDIKINRLRFNQQTLAKMQEYSEEKYGVLYTIEDVETKLKNLLETCKNEIGDIIKKHDLEEAEKRRKEELRRAKEEAEKRHQEEEERKRRQEREYAEETQRIAENARRTAAQAQRIMEENLQRARRYAVHDTSGPSRSSMMTGEFY